MDLKFDIPHTTKIGRVQIDKHLEHRVTCEFAAWGHTIFGDIGRFDLHLGVTNQPGLNKVALFAEVPGTVTSSSYASHFGGVAYGSRGIDEMVGQRESFMHRVNITDVFEDYHVQIFDEFAESFILTVLNFISDSVLNEQARTAKLTDKLFTPCNISGISGEFGGEYDQYQAGHAAYCAENITIMLKLMNKIMDGKPVGLDGIIKKWIYKWNKNVDYWNNNDRYNKIDTTKNIQIDIPSVTNG